MGQLRSQFAARICRTLGHSCTVRHPERGTLGHSCTVRHPERKQIEFVYASRDGGEQRRRKFAIHDVAEHDGVLMAAYVSTGLALQMANTKETRVLPAR
eukprot:3768236-Rhodomonas_salina.2